jgi:hypothetical protein
VIVLGWIVAGLSVLFLLRVVRGRRGRVVRVMALPIDTGVRSGWRTPGRRHRPHRGF